MDGDDLLIAGASFDRTGNIVRGSAIIFAKNEDGIWEQQAKLVPHDGGYNDYFGREAAISGNTAMVGAYFHVGLRADGGTYGIRSSLRLCQRRQWEFGVYSGTLCLLFSCFLLSLSMI